MPTGLLHRPIHFSSADPRTKLHNPLTDPTSRVFFSTHRPRSLAINGFFYHSVKPHTFQHTSPISPLSPTSIDHSIKHQSISLSFFSFFFGKPIYLSVGFSVWVCLCVGVFVCWFVCVDVFVCGCGCVCVHLRKKKMRREKSSLCTKKREKKKVRTEINKIINKNATVTVHICTVTVAIMHLYTIIYKLVWMVFCSNCVKLAPFSILHNYP